MASDLQYDLCPGCGERKAVGIFAMISHGCPLNTVNYYVGSFGMKHLRRLFGEIDPILKMKEDLLQFQHLKAMPDYDRASELDKKIYAICRESDIRTMKRLRAYIDLEERFDSKY